MQATPLVFKIADSDEEFEQIHRLNYQTFVEEIPQHSANGCGSLQDKFHGENLYIVALRGKKLAGMMAVRDRRPFSLDAKVPNLDELLPPHHSACEVRLLAVVLEERHGYVFYGLLNFVSKYCVTHGYDLALISGTTRQQRLYRHLGFKPFGPLVGETGAQFQPMYLTWQNFKQAHSQPVHLQPGPVPLRLKVRSTLHRAFRQCASHRSEEFHTTINATRPKLCELTGAVNVEIALGSGTLANDLVAGQLRLQAGRGLVLSNGEFGERLIDHARRAGLNFVTHCIEWGATFAMETVADLLRTHDCTWLWAVHCETSTGVLNHLTALRAITAEHDVHLCLDCVSSLGAMPVDLRDVFLASGSSGKALGAPAGLALVFSKHQAVPAPDVLPRYLDLGLYAHCDHVPFTHSTPLVAALNTALEYQTPNFWNSLDVLGQSLYKGLGAHGFSLVAEEEHRAPFIITIALPGTVQSVIIGQKLEERGFLTSYRSDYLLRRNWIQFCLMSEQNQQSLQYLPDLLKHLVTTESAA